MTIRPALCRQNLVLVHSSVHSCGKRAETGNEKAAYSTLSVESGETRSAPPRLALLGRTLVDGKAPPVSPLPEIGRARSGDPRSAHRCRQGQDGAWGANRGPLAHRGGSGVLSGPARVGREVRASTTPCRERTQAPVETVDKTGDSGRDRSASSTAAVDYWGARDAWGAQRGGRSCQGAAARAAAPWRLVHAPPRPFDARFPHLYTSLPFYVCSAKIV